MGKYKEEQVRVPMEECIPRRLYKIGSRNLSYGVYDGNAGFIGIRCKFRDKYLFTEYHWDQGPPFGTVYRVVDTGIDLPSEIPLCESPGTYDQHTDRPVAFDKPVADGGRGWYFTDTDEASEEIRPVGRANAELFDFLAESWVETGTHLRNCDPTPD